MPGGKTKAAGMAQDAAPESPAFRAAATGQKHWYS